VASLTPSQTAAGDAVAGQLAELRRLLVELVERLDPVAPDLAAHEDARAIALQVKTWPSAKVKDLGYADLRRLGDLCGAALTLEFSIGDYLLLSVQPGLAGAAFASFLRDAEEAQELVVSLKVDKAALLSRLSAAAAPAGHGGGQASDAPPGVLPASRGGA
jgi:hypothetical protein